MFTGLITDVATIAQVRQTPDGRELAVRCGHDDLADGESIALDGVCLTVRERSPGGFVVAAVHTTLSRTTLGEWAPGRRVNIERALRAGDRMGGHIVQGHVDAVGDVSAARREGDAVLLDVAVPEVIATLLVPHGSIAVDGVSLTVNELPAPGILQLSLIGHTLRHTNLGDRKPGDRVNLEGDVIGKYVQRLMEPYGAPARRGVGG